MTLTAASLVKGNVATLSQADGSNEKKLDRSISFQNWEPEDPQLPDSIHSGKAVAGKLNLPSLSHLTMQKTNLTISLPEPMVIFSPKPTSELNAAATKLQKVYKSYRTRRNLADCAVVVEELWWKALDSAALRQSSISFFDVKKPETALSRWTRAMTRVAKVGKGLSKDEKAQKLALQHWLEAIDPRHRYGHNLHLYYDVWSNTRSTQPFFYWLDVGDGKEVNIHSCPRAILQRQCISYLGPKEREAYEVIVEGGKLLYRQNGVLLHTTEGTKWIFVLSTSRNLYVGQKKKGVFQHSSFLSGAAITAAGRLVAFDGALDAIWPYSGHYLPTEENFKEFIAFLDGNNVDLTRVKTCAIDDDYSSPELSSEDSMNASSVNNANSAVPTSVDDVVCVQQEHSGGMGGTPIFEASKRMSCKWSNGLGPRIGCVREYPLELQSQALEQVNLSPIIHGRAAGCTSIPSPRPSPRILVSPRLAYMGLPTS